MRIRTGFATLSALAGIAATFPAMSQEQCLQSGGGPYTLEGQLTTGRFRDAAGRPQTAFILVLSRPVCMTGQEDEDKVKGTSRVHVFGGEEAMQKRLQGLAGRRIAATGEPFGAHTAHHHAPIVFSVAKVEPR